MSSENSKRADEIFCRSCGEVIKREAEICPDCGVRNTNASDSSPQKASSPTPSTTHDPSRYETTTSDTWWYAVAGATGLWILIFVLAGGGISNAFVGGLTLIAWVGLPVAAYFDIQYVRANGEWNPSTVIWVVLSAVWLINIIAGAAYLYRRHEVLGEP